MRSGDQKRAYDEAQPLFWNGQVHIAKEDLPDASGLQRDICRCRSRLLLHKMQDDSQWQLVLVRLHTFKVDVRPIRCRCDYS